MTDHSTPPSSPTLKQRVNPVHLQQRLGIEAEGEAPVFGQGRQFFNIENFLSLHRFIDLGLKLTGLARKGKNNCFKPRFTDNIIVSEHIGEAFDGFRILHLSDLHIDLDERFAEHLCKSIEPLDYDLCVLTGDYRYKTSGPIGGALLGMEQLRESIFGEALMILGNHDSIAMVPSLEAMGYHLMLNESTVIEKNNERIFISGVDDPHFFRTDNLEKACQGIRESDFSLLLVHSPELYKQAAYANFNALLCGHTHGGQICLPGGIPLIANADCPRRMARGAWRYDDLQGYTSSGCGASIAPARFNCPPEIVIHTLKSSQTTCAV